ncbi:MAG: hypothetical protein A07HR60_01590 [uncultured archaeon A07HR60]|jgi:Uncharacterized protein conserved in bacteria|nr:MAG: hypothetical protein A07HR60_01590 [uncultured archaeon A07HR60]
MATTDDSDTPDEKNVHGEPLQPCGTDPETGFARDGYCRTHPQDRGCHEICAVVTEEFLTQSRQQGNDLITPRPEYGFPGLEPGDRWCLCVSRWAETVDAGKAPPVVLAATNESALSTVELETLEQHAYDADN